MTQTVLEVAICDDDAVILKQMKNLCSSVLSEQYAVNVWATTSPENLLMRREPFDIILLDMQFPEQYGVSIAQELFEKNSSCRIIFVSGFITSVSSAYEVPHFAMVMKEQLDVYLPRFLLRAAALIEEEKNNKIVISVKKEQVALSLAEIAVIERIGHWTYFYMIGEDPTVSMEEKLRTREKLGDLLQRIGNPQFCRCHISYAVNLKHVKRLQKHDFEMGIGKSETMLVPISRFYEKSSRDEFFQQLSSSTSHSII